MAIRQSTSTSSSPSPFPHEEGNLVTPGDTEERNYIEKSVLLDIAFLHSIATHRPIGPHKHFNVIPILLNLDRTARQVGARIRDDGYIRGASGEDEGEGSLTRSIKKEEDEDTSNASLAFVSLPIDSQMIWVRLDQLYDVGGLEELENLAVDNDVASPFRNGHSLYLGRSSIQTSPAVSASTQFGFGSGLEKKKKISSTSTPKSARSNPKKVAAITEEDEDANDSLTNEPQIEFELGPWDDYESLIAPRRLKSYAPQEDGQSESEEDLSEPSDVEGNEEVNDEEQQEDDGEALSEEDEGDDNIDGEDDEDGDTSTSKRKASLKKQGGSSKKGKKSSSPPVKSRGTRQSTKPRRSTRR